MIYSYDPMGRVVGYWQCTPYNCGSSAWKVAYNFDLAGDVTSYRHPEGWTVTNTVNNAQQITQVQSSWVDSTHPQYLAQNITYMPWGAEQTLTNGCAGSGCTSTAETYVYNNRLQPVVLELGSTANPTADYCAVYNYYASVGNPSSCNTPSQGQSDNGDVLGYLFQDNVNPSSFGRTESYTYDALNRLTNGASVDNDAGYNYNLTFAYDSYGNMTCQVNAQTDGYCPTWTYNGATNQFNMSGFTYDADGNLTADASHTYQYDAEGHLTGVDNGSTATLAYNALGQEVEAKWPSYQLENQYDPHGRLSGVYSAGEGRWWNGNIWWGGRTLSRTWGWSFQHERVAGITTMTSLNDGSIGIDELWNPWGGAWAYIGDAYGGYFGGLLGDPEPPQNIYPAQNRMYNNNISRWFTPDPNNAGADPSNPQSWNAYSYAGNNPTTNTDPSGEDYKVCLTDELGQSHCTNIENESQFQSFLADPGPGYKISGNSLSGNISLTNLLTGQQTFEGTYEQVPGPGSEGMETGGVSDASIPLIGLVSAGVGLVSGAVEEGVGALGRMLGIGGEEAAPLVTATITSVTPDLAEAGEVAQKALAAIGDQSVTVSNESVARAAADEFLGTKKVPITDRTTGVFKGWRTPDGTRVVVDTHSDGLGPHMNFHNTITGGNLHVRW